VPPPQQDIDVARVLGNSYKTCIPVQSARLGFTLAEVLITLGIIGVVAAITIPTLIASHRTKVLETQFKKSHSELTQALALLKKDDITIYGNYYGNDIQNLLVKSFKDAKLENPQNYLGNYRNYSKGNDFNRRVLDDGMIITSSGYFIFINNDYNNPNSIQFFVDINGEKAPNILGYDLFQFPLQEGDKLELIANPYHCNDTVTGAGSGGSCAYYALTDKDYFKKLKW